MRPPLAMVMLLTLMALDGARAKANEARTAEVVEAVAPHYPSNGCKARVQGRVEVEGTVLPSGTLANLHAKGIPLLKEAAEAAALDWRFRTAIQPATVRLTFVFKVVLTSGEAAALDTTTFRPPFEVEVRCGLTVNTMSIGD